MRLGNTPPEQLYTCQADTCTPEGARRDAERRAVGKVVYASGLAIGAWMLWKLFGGSK